ncbi:MAG: hypothetical protein A2Y78_00185 [Acidobacteria bacterium RBG_13_68_16]|nr:MAG: hypothetical protein A2Y78_00185 [Acidobacteria bacterium RBG_13_68_16]
MAMSSSVLSAALRAAMLADTAIGAVDGPALTAMCDAIAAAVVTHITGSAVVTVPLGVAVQVVPATGTGATTAPGVGAIT